MSTSQWFEKKNRLKEQNKLNMFEERQIWLIYFGINVGSEINGNEKSFIRPGIILKKHSKQSCTIAPLTSQYKNHPYRFPLGNIKFLKKESWINLTQIKTIDVRRLKRKLGKTPQALFQNITKKSAEMISASGPKGKNAK